MDRILDVDSSFVINKDANTVRRKDIICFSHLRWDFVFQRPQQLLSRAAQENRVIFWEEPIWSDARLPCLSVSETKDGVIVVQPRLHHDASGSADVLQRELLDNFLRQADIRDPILWYYTPAALTFSSHLAGNPVVYDCMDELSAFRFSDPELPKRERELLSRAALVFTGGHSLYQTKSLLHSNVHAFPSGVDVAHFRPAREGLTDPKDQSHVAHPRLGFYGVLDERLDLELLKELAEAKPDWQIVMVGPVVKIAREDLPALPNIHYLGPKSYEELPYYLANWDVALMPFAINEATRFISPTKTPEYLAGGCPVVSTPIVDVVQGYKSVRGVEIARDIKEFISAVERCLVLANGDRAWLTALDLRLASMSWDRTWQNMAGLIGSKLDIRTTVKRPVTRLVQTGTRPAEAQYAASS